MRATKAKDLQQYQQRLLSLRKGLSGKVDHVAAAIQDDANSAGNPSAAPVHIADQASSTLDVDIDVLQNERDLLAEIDNALGRIDAKTFGICEECGSAIAEQRLQAIPYTSLCIKCARSE